MPYPLHNITLEKESPRRPTHRLPGGERRVWRPLKSDRALNRAGLMSEVATLTTLTLIRTLTLNHNPSPSSSSNPNHNPSPSSNPRLLAPPAEPNDN